LKNATFFCKLDKKFPLNGVQKSKKPIFENYPKKNANNSKTAPRILLIFSQNQVQGLYYRYLSNLEKVIIAFSSNNFLKRGRKSQKSEKWPKNADFGPFLAILPQL